MNLGLDRTPGEPMYEVDKNPHNSLSRLSPLGVVGDWECTYCGWVGAWEDENKVACTYEYPPCKSCGLTPICAWDCTGIETALSNPNAYVIGIE